MNTDNLAGFHLFVYCLGYAVFALLAVAAIFIAAYALFALVDHVRRGRAALRENESLLRSLSRATSEVTSLENQLRGRDMEIEVLRHSLGDTRGSYRGELGEGSGKVAGEKPEGRAAS